MSGVKGVVQTVCVCEWKCGGQGVGANEAGGSCGVGGWGMERDVCASTHPPLQCVRNAPSSLLLQTNLNTHHRGRTPWHRARGGCTLQAQVPPCTLCTPLLLGARQQSPSAGSWRTGPRRCRGLRGRGVVGTGLGGLGGGVIGRRAVCGLMPQNTQAMQACVTCSCHDAHVVAWHRRTCTARLHARHAFLQSTL